MIGSRCSTELSFIMMRALTFNNTFSITGSVTILSQDSTKLSYLWKDFGISRSGVIWTPI
ncbi:hypothetical protein HanXRQr2_Chr00c002g0832471 [Helianthus annuus]|uniref:Uncharacterized protein n=1 Tax=Helianthus annuus TaxID=4232 RepID=A0A9K3JZE5_HELAN|nr:hypothetical protein HanXRQr2_Chr00c002g0832471 [Helianthus annuus]